MMMKSFGAMNVSTFRENVKRGNVPQKESITFEGLFSTYFFDTGIKETKELVHPTYSIAQCRNYSNDTVEKYISLGLNSSEDGKNVRNPLNCIIVLDISGSMGSYFDFRKSGEGYSKQSKEKMEIAKDVLKDIVKDLKEDERFGLILFDDRVEITQPIRTKKQLDLSELMDSIEEIKARGGTNMEIGLRTAVEMFEDLLSEEENAKEMNNRIIFLTDAHPTLGGGKNSLIYLSKRAAKRNIFTTFIGIGLDFNSEIVNEIAKVRGSNYFSIHSQKAFRKILNEDFNYIVTPLVFNCVLFFESEGLEIDKCYGTPYADETNGVLMKIESLSASAKRKSGETKGGIILIKLKEKVSSKLEPSENVKITLRYELPNGKKIQSVHAFNFKVRCLELITQLKIFENAGIRKAILLSRYGTIVRDVLENARRNNGNPTYEDKKKLKEFKKYFVEEFKILKDPHLSKELDVIDRLVYQK